MRDTRGFGTLISISAGRRPVRIDLRSRVKVDALLHYGDCTFVVNDNVHRTGRCLRGLLICTFYDIGHVVKAEGRHAVYQPLLPRRGELRLLDLYDPNIQPLQQVSGLLVCNPNKVCISKHDGNGHVRKCPNGPDTVYFSTVDIPSTMLNALNKSSFVSVGDYDKVLKKTYCPKRVPVIYVLTSEKTRRHVDKTKGACRYSIPCGFLQKVSKWYVSFFCVSLFLFIYCILNQI